MDSRMIAAAALAAISLGLGTGILMARSVPADSVFAKDTRSSVSAPGVDVKTSDDATTIKAPYTRVEKNASGTHVEAPGVSIQIPKKSTE